MARAFVSAVVAFVLMAGVTLAADKKIEGTIVKVDVAKKILTVKVGEESKEYEVNEETKFIGPKGGESREGIKDTRLVKGVAVNLVIAGNNRTAREVHIPAAVEKKPAPKKVEVPPTTKTTTPAKPAPVATTTPPAKPAPTTKTTTPPKTAPAVTKTEPATKPAPTTKTAPTSTSTPSTTKPAVTKAPATKPAEVTNAPATKPAETTKAPATTKPAPSVARVTPPTKTATPEKTTAAVTKTPEPKTPKTPAKPARPRVEKPIPANAVIGTTAADAPGTKAKVVKVDAERKALVVTLEDGKQTEIKTNEQTEFIGPRGGVSSYKLKDDRLTAGYEVKFVLGADKVATEIHMSYRPRKPTDK